MRQTTNSAFQSALVVAAAVTLTLSVTPGPRPFVGTSPLENLHLVNAKPVLGVSRPVKPSHKEYLELVRIHGSHRKGQRTR